MRMQDVKPVSELEETLWFQMRSAGLDLPEREVRFAEALGRRYRFDFCWRDRKLAVEVDGGTRTRGRHNRHEGMKADNAKLNLAVQLGWRVLRFTGDEVTSGAALTVIEQTLMGGVV